MKDNLMIRKGFGRTPRAWRERFLAVARQAEALSATPAQAAFGVARRPAMTRKSTLQPRISPVRRMSLAPTGAGA
jgi:hypothetical protein